MAFGIFGGFARTFFAQLKSVSLATLALIAFGLAFLGAPSDAVALNCPGASGTEPGDLYADLEANADECATSVTGAQISVRIGDSSIGTFQFADNDTIATTSTASATGNCDSGSLFGFGFVTRYLDVGSCTISATFTNNYSMTLVVTVSAGAGDYYASAVTATVTPAPRADTSTVVSANPSTATYGDTVTLTARVTANSGSGTPGRSVGFYNGAALLGTATLNGGSATLTTSSLPLGSNSIYAVYDGDANFNSSSSGLTTVTVNKANTTTTLTSSLPAPRPART